MRVLLALASLTLLTSACGLPFGCGPAPQCKSAEIVGAGWQCGDDSCQVCRDGLVCAYDEHTGDQRCGGLEPPAIAPKPDLSSLPDLASQPDGGALDLPDADADPSDAGRGPDLE